MINPSAAFFRIHPMMRMEPKSENGCFVVKVSLSVLVASSSYVVVPASLCDVVDSASSSSSFGILEIIIHSHFLKGGKEGRVFPRMHLFRREEVSRSPGLAPPPPTPPTPPSPLSPTAALRWLTQPGDDGRPRCLLCLSVRPYPDGPHTLIGTQQEGGRGASLNMHGVLNLMATRAALP